MAMSCIKLRILQGIIDSIDGHLISEELEEMLEQIRRMLDLPRMVPEIALTSDRVTPEHFLQWDPRVFLPGPKTRKSNSQRREKVVNAVFIIWILSVTI